MVQDDWTCIGECKWQGHKEREGGEKTGKTVCMHVLLTALELLYALPSLTGAHSSSSIHQLH